MRVTGHLIALALCGWSVLALAQSSTTAHNHFKWRDGQGNLHYDDSLPDEAIKYGYDIINSNGLVLKHVERAKTTEELKAEKAQAEKTAAAQRAADEQLKNDQQILAAYPTETDLVASQKAQIDMIDQTVLATQVSLQNQEKSLSELLAHAADLDRNGKPVPVSLQQQIDSLRVTIEKQKAYITNKGAEKDADTQRFASELAHYRDIQAKHNQK